MRRASMPGTITAAPVAQAAVSSNAIHPLQVADWSETGLLVGYALTRPPPSCSVPVSKILGSVDPFFLDSCTINANDPSVHIQLEALTCSASAKPP